MFCAHDSPDDTAPAHVFAPGSHVFCVVAAPKKAIAKKPAKAKASKGKAAKPKAAKGKASKGKDDKPKVKRAPGPYMTLQGGRPKIVKANPNMPFGEVGKALGAAGKLSDAKSQVQVDRLRTAPLRASPAASTAPRLETK